MPFPIAVLAVVFALIAVRGLDRLRLPIWAVMSAGALVVLLTGDIGAADAVRAVNLDVMLFLFGVFVLGQALESSGYLFHLSHRLFSGAGSADGLMLRVLFGAGFASALLMNDTLAILGTPLVLRLAREHRLAPAPLLLALAFAVTLGSVLSPIGNPQNLLIALHGGFANPFRDFAATLALPTAINLAAAFFLLKWRYPGSFHNDALVHVRHELRDPPAARLARASLLLLVALVGIKIASAFFALAFEFRLTYIALAAAAPILLFSPRRWQLLREIDWRTLAFFAAMFVLMAAVWNSGFFQSWMERGEGGPMSVAAVLTVSVLLSQLMSNVPLVALYLPVLLHAGAAPQALLALAAGSTIAGNLFILGAASNVIIVQNAERKTGQGIGFLDFARLGVPLTAVNAAVYWAFLTWF